MKDFRVMAKGEPENGRCSLVEQISGAHESRNRQTREAPSLRGEMELKRQQGFKK